MSTPPARALDFSEADDARDYLSRHGYRRFSRRTFQSRHGKTARWSECGRGCVRITII